MSFVGSQINGSRYILIETDVIRPRAEICAVAIREGRDETIHHFAQDERESRYKDN